jgi:hypothetical protein
MLEGLIETQQIGGFYTLQVKQKARENQLVGTERILLKRVSQHA